MSTATIDLGELPRGEPIEVDVPGPVRERLRRLRPRHLRWAATAAGIAALVLATTAAAAGQPGPALTLHTVLPYQAFGLDQENMYVVDDTDGPIASRLTAYTLTDGAVRWRVSLPAPSAWVETERGLLVVTSEESADGQGLETTSRLDPGTGRRLWTREGWPNGHSGDLVLLWRLLPVDVASYELPPRYEVSAVSFATGEAAWAREVSGSASYVPGDRGRLVALGTGGQLRSYDAATGRQLRSASVPVPDLVELYVAGSVALLFHPQARSEFVAYDPDTLTRLWTLEGDENTWLEECGRLLCVTGIGRARAIHPTTGESAWSPGWLPEGRRSDWFSVSVPEAPALSGYFLLNRQSEAGRLTGSWLIDADTGEPALDLKEWVLAPSQRGPAPERPKAIWHEHEVTWIGELREDLSGIDPIGPIDLPDPEDHQYCMIPDGWVMCETYPTADLESPVLSVWRIR